MYLGESWKINWIDDVPFKSVYKTVYFAKNQYQSVWNGLKQFK